MWIHFAWFLFLSLAGKEKLFLFLPLHLKWKAGSNSTNKDYLYKIINEIPISCANSERILNGIWIFAFDVSGWMKSHEDLFKFMSSEKEHKWIAPQRTSYIAPERRWWWHEKIDIIIIFSVCHIYLVLEHLYSLVDY